MDATIAPTASSAKQTVSVNERAHVEEEASDRKRYGRHKVVPVECRHPGEKKVGE